MSRPEGTRDQVVVVGGGISGLAFAYYVAEEARRRALPVDVLVLEQSRWVGGRVRSLREDGYIVECGANGVLGSKPSTVGLAYEIGLGDELVRAAPVARWRYIYHEGELKALPLSLLQFARSSLLSTRAKWRLLREPLVRRWRQSPDPSVAEWARWRFGSEATEVFVDAVCAGVYGVPPHALSLRAAFPQLWEWEQRYGSVLIGALVQRKPKDRPRYEESLPADFPRRGLWSLRSGLGRLSERLAEKIGQVQTGRSVVHLGRYEGRWRVVTADRCTIAADWLVLATDARTAAELLRPLDAAAADILATIRFVPLVVLGLGYRREQVPHPLNGFGYLVPSRERRGVLGVLWSSSVFPNRAPQGHVLLRVIAGGLDDSYLVEASETELLDVVGAELQRTLGINDPPTYCRIIRWPYAIPIPECGHAERVGRLRERLQRLPQFVLLGNYLNGVSVNDCVANACQAAMDVVSRLSCRYDSAPSVSNQR